MRLLTTRSGLRLRLHFLIVFQQKPGQLNLTQQESNFLHYDQTDEEIREVWSVKVFMIACLTAQFVSGLAMQLNGSNMKPIHQTKCHRFALVDRSLSKIVLCDPTDLKKQKKNNQQVLLHLERKSTSVQKSIWDGQTVHMIQ